MASYRLNAGLTYADLGEPCLEFANANVVRLAQILGPLAVDFAEAPSASLNVRVAAGNFRASDGQRVAYAGAASVAIPAGGTRYLWLDDAGALQQGPAWPSGAVVRLAVVVSGATTIASVADARELAIAFGSGAGSYLQLSGGTLAGDLTLATGVDVVLASGGAGTAIGTATDQLLGFHGATPVVQAASADQGALADSTGGSTADFILASEALASAITDSSGGTASTTIASLAPPAALTGGAGGSADGAIQSISGSYSQAEIANNFEELMTRVNQLITLGTAQQDAIASLAARADELRLGAITANSNTAKLARLLGAIRAALVTKGLLKGSA